MSMIFDRIIKSDEKSVIFGDVEAAKAELKRSLKVYPENPRLKAFLDS